MVQSTFLIRAEEGRLKFIYLLLPIMLLLGCQSTSRGSHPTDPVGAVSAMSHLTQQSNIAQAVEVGKVALEENPGDARLLKALSLTYLLMAGKDERGRAEHIGRAMQYNEQLLESPAEDELGRFLNLVDAAMHFSIAGDLSPGDKCAFYQRAASTLAQMPAPAGDSIVLDGREFPLQPLYQQRETVAAQLQEKLSAAECRTSLPTQETRNPSSR
jgi:hypothetical protein